MKTIEFLPHTADLKMRLRADSVIRLFEAGMEGMKQVMKKGACKTNNNTTVKVKIHITSPDLTSLLVEFLGEVLTLSHNLKTIFCRLKVASVNNQEIIGQIEGVKVVDFDEDIKAVTYHEADVQVNDQGTYETFIIFDI